MQSSLPINFPWINLTAKLGVLPYFLRLSLAHLPGGRAGTSGWHQTVIFLSSFLIGCTYCSSDAPSLLHTQVGFANLFGAREDVCIQRDGVWGLYPKYQSNLVRVWKTDNTHSGNHSHPETILARACGCSCSLSGPWEPQARF